MGAKIKELKTGFEGWLAKQSLPVEAAIVTLTGGVRGAFLGLLIGTFTALYGTHQVGLNPEAMVSLKQTQALVGPLEKARKFAASGGVDDCISCVMRRLRGKEDVWTCMAAGFGSGAAFSLVSGEGAGPDRVADALISAVVFALGQGVFFKLEEKASKKLTPTEDFYSKTRSMLIKLGLQNYENNFKKALLTDSTLPLLTDSALREVKIPLGPRLLILDHIQRNPELKGER